MAKTNYEKIKNMSIEEMAKFLKTLVDDNNDHEVGCYDCNDYGTHYYTDEYGTCTFCEMFDIGLDIQKWLENCTGGK